jgi:hypothetical protein
VDCERALRADPDAFATWRAAEAVPLARYEALLERHAWRETLPRDALAPMPRFTDVLDAQQLYLLQTRELARAGDAAAVRRRLDADHAYWRVVLAASDTLITRMIAVAAVRRHFDLGNLALRALPVQRADDAVPPSWARPFSTAERSMSRALAGEWRFTDATLKASATGGKPGYGEAPASVPAGQRIQWAVSRPFLRVQATSNRFAARAAELAALSELPADRLPAAVDARFDEWDRQRTLWRAYNPLGNMLMSMGAEQGMRDYLFRGTDLEGLRRATLLAQSLRSRALADADIAAAVDTAALRDPYTGAALGWDAAPRAVVVSGNSRRADARREVML